MITGSACANAGVNDVRDFADRWLIERSLEPWAWTITAGPKFGSARFWVHALGSCGVGRELVALPGIEPGFED